MEAGRAANNLTVKARSTDDERDQRQREKLHGEELLSEREKGADTALGHVVAALRLPLGREAVARFLQRDL